MQNKKVTLLINGEQIDQNLLEKERHVLREGYRGIHVDEDPEKLEERIERDARENVVERFLILQAARKAGMEPSRTQIEARFQEDRKRYGVKKEDVDPDLATKVKADTKDQLTTELYLKSIWRELPVPSEAECRAYYQENEADFLVPERVHALQIFLAPGPGHSASAVYNKLQEVREALREGADFAHMIRALTNGQGQEDEGDLGLFARGDLPFGPAFDDAAFSAGVKEISEVLSSEFGFHIIKVLEKHPAKGLTFEEAREGIANALLEMRKEERMAEAIEALKENVKVEVREESS